jgi:hypothetical protein
MEENTQCLYIGAMPTDANGFPGITTNPLQFTLVTCTKRKSQDAIDLALQVELIHSHALIPKIVYADLQSTFCSMTTILSDVDLDTGSAKDYISNINAYI